MVPKRTIRSSPATTTTTTTPVTDAQLKALIDQSVVDALAARNINRSQNHEDIHDFRTGVRRQAPLTLEGRSKGGDDVGNGIGKSGGVHDGGVSDRGLAGSGGDGICGSYDEYDVSGDGGGDEDHEEDLADYPIDRDDDDDDDKESFRDDADDEVEDEEKDEEEEEHPPSADSISPPPVHRTTARISIPAQVHVPFMSDVEVERLLSLPTPPPSPLTSVTSHSEICN
nr:hypothetical protein [Tanacetum cinerariifolium]